MPAWLSEVLPYVAPVILAVTSAFLGASVLTPRRLRKDVADDLAIASGLIGRPKALLLNQVHNRTIQLSALIEYPALMPKDSARLAIIIFMNAAAAFFCWDWQRSSPDRVYVLEDVVPWLFFLVFTTYNWYELYVSWHWRSLDRSEYLTRHGVEVDEDHVYLFRRIGTQLWWFFGLACVLAAPLIYLVILSDTYADQRRVIALMAALGLVAGMIIIVYLASSAERTRPRTRSERRQEEFDRVEENLRARAERVEERDARIAAGVTKPSPLTRTRRWMSGRLRWLADRVDSKSTSG